MRDLLNPVFILLARALQSQVAQQLQYKSVECEVLRSMLPLHIRIPRPPHDDESWKEFIARHIDTLWACDFFTQSVHTIRGRIDYHVLMLLHVGTRRSIS